MENPVRRKRWPPSKVKNAKKHKNDAEDSTSKKATKKDAAIITNADCMHRESCFSNSTIAGRLCRTRLPTARF